MIKILCPWNNLWNKNFRVVTVTVVMPIESGWEVWGKSLPLYSDFANDYTQSD
ncbi:hypothetical protein [Bacillus sp. REN16]|uniref:hypothetical protein n=1 Tax=Bacillus sp. REN16 TaxID=2887296 RepID=UPI001E5311A2|nr:hypothetical protein [Bacillus sp. REN16]MCC3359601.1 hypothetical protein [Bacillus sp. REN16]